MTRDPLSNLKSNIPPISLNTLLNGSYDGYLFYFVSWSESLINYSLLYKITTLSFKPMECQLIIFLNH